MKNYKIEDKLYLIEKEVVPVVLDQVTQVSDNLNHIWIFDRSGSMSGTLNSLVQDLIQKSKELKVGDVLSIGWFSGESQYRFALKGFKIGNDKDFETIESALKPLRSTVGLTCFSEIIYDTETVVKELGIFGLDFALMFLTDGYPVVSNYDKEIKNIFDAISKVQKSIASCLLVGYGNYYNKELMSKMAEAFGGDLIHSGNILSFSQDFKTHLEDSRENGAKIKIKMDAKIEVPFSINGRQVNVYSQEEDNILYFTPSKNKTNYLYYLSESEIGDQVQCDFSKDKLGQEETRFMKALYALSYILSGRTKTDLALKVLSKIGDVALLDGIINAFTNEEYGEVESHMKKAVYSTKDRYLNGKNLSYLPDENATCIVDIIDILTLDQETLFYPYHPDLEYNKISRSSEQKDKDLKFITGEENPGVPISNLTWNQTKLNLSVLINIGGSVNLDQDSSKFGFAQTYPTFIWRNYSVIKDGFLNMPEIYVKPSFLVWDKLKAVEKKEGKDLFIDSGDGSGKLILRNFPVMNRGMAKNYNSATELCKLSVEELRLESAIKISKSMLKELEEVKTKSVLSPEAEAYLARFGIGKDGSFSPPKTILESTDSYFAKEFKIDISKFSNLPSLNALKTKLEKLESDKTGKVKLTESESLMKTSLDSINEQLGSITDLKSKKLILEGCLENLKSKLKEIRKTIQRIKFAIILGKQSFKEFNSREENTLDVDGFQFKISVREVEVKI
jgi:hypothetical protein